MKKVTCQICQAPSDFLFNIDGYEIFACKKCKHQFSNIELTNEHLSVQFGDHYFFSGGVGYPNYLADSDIRTAVGRNYAQIVEPYIGPGKQHRTMLDIGCAAGFIMKGFKDSGWQPTGIEPNQSMVEYAQENLGLDALNGNLEDVNLIEKIFTETKGFDLISVIQVVAHLTDLHTSFAAIQKLLKPDGLLLIETWDCHSLTARILGQKWHEYSPPNVLHFFSRTSLNLLAANFGFHVIATGRPSKKISMEHARSLLHYKYGDHGIGYFFQKIMRALPRNASIPYPAEDLFWTLYRKSPLH